MPNPFYGLLPVAYHGRCGRRTVSAAEAAGPVSAVHQRGGRTTEPGHRAGTTRCRRSCSSGSSSDSHTWFRTPGRRPWRPSSYLNPQDTQLSRELVAFDTPHRLVASGLYEFPIGPHRKCDESRAGFAHHRRMAGQLGRHVPVGLPDRAARTITFTATRSCRAGRALNHWFNTSPAIWVQRPPDTLRTAKLNSPRYPPLLRAPQVDLTVMREFRITERQRFPIQSATAFNATNTPLFDVPNTTPTSPLFGVVPITQRNLPRSIELGFRYAF